MKLLKFDMSSHMGFVVTENFKGHKCFLGMGSEHDDVVNSQVVDARARNISHNVRCTECGSQSIEDSQADIAVLLRKVCLLFNSLVTCTYWFG